MTDEECVCPTCGRKLPKNGKTGKRLSEDWFLPAEWGEWALRYGWARKEIEEAAECFRDYWIAKSGKDATKIDWFATWRNWIRNSRKSGRVMLSLDERNAKAVEGFLNRRKEIQ